MYGGQSAAKRFLIITPGSLVKVSDRNLNMLNLCMPIDQYHWMIFHSYHA